jgi:GT2 family glycosyltransferase
VPWQHSREIPDLERFSAERAIAHRRKFRFQTLMTSFCMLVRRAVVDEIGGFDERFSPWGFEDDDFSMRAALAGFRNRVALDVFVRHDHYGGAKLKKHEELLARNWSRFAQKWCGDGTLPYGDYPALQPAMRRAFTRADYHVSLVEPPPTLPTKDQVRQEIEA